MDLKIKDVADLLNVSQTTIRRWLVDGKIPAYKINHQYRFNRVEIEDWVMSHKVGVHKETPPYNQQKKLKGSKPQGGINQFSLYRALNKGNIISNVEGKTKEDVIKKAMHSVAKDLHLDAEVLTHLLLERENLQPTALNNGIGIPHTRDFLLSDTFDVVTIAFPKKAISYGALDGKPVHTLFFLFANHDKKHLHLLAKIAHLCSLPQTIDLLKQKPSKDAFLEYVKNWESKIQKIKS